MIFCSISLDNCINPVGIESGKVPDEAFQDNIETPVAHQVNINPTDARLNKVVSSYPFGWMAPADKQAWLQIDLGTMFKVRIFNLVHNCTVV